MVVVRGAVGSMRTQSGCGRVAKGEETGETRTLISVRLALSSCPAAPLARPRLRLPSRSTSPAPSACRRSDPKAASETSAPVHVHLALSHLRRFHLLLPTAQFLHCRASL